MDSILVRINALKYNLEKKKINLVSQDVRIIETQIFGLYSVKSKFCLLMGICSN